MTGATSNTSRGASAVQSRPHEALSEAQGTLDGLIDQWAAFGSGKGTQPDTTKFLTGLRMVHDQIGQAMAAWSSNGSGTSGGT